MTCLCGVAVIVEATYGISRHEARHEREERFKRKIRDTVLGGGSVLLPIVALGRAQVRILHLLNTSPLSSVFYLQGPLSGLP